jgi:acyl-CoA synthetase (NDP forming)
MSTTSPRSFLNPSSIAVVGAGERATSSGGAVLSMLRKSGFKGRVIPVNPKGGVIQGLAAVTSLAEVRPAAELVAILVRPEVILQVVEEAAASGHQNLLILPGGFAEAGGEGLVRDARLRAMALAHGLTIGGPNCAGNINLMDAGAPFAATFFRDLPRGGGVAMISQSGALIEEAIAASHRTCIPLGAVVSVGNGMQLNLARYVEHFADDARCRVILLYIESLGDEAGLGSALRYASGRKPVIALVGGRSAEGRAAAFFHTGARAARADLVAKFCHDSGLLRVSSMRELMLGAKALGRYPEGIGRRVLLLSNSGGPGVIAADRAVDCGLQLVPLSEHLQQQLRALVPIEATVANPLDLLADAREDRFGTTLEAALRSNEFDAILMIHVVPFMVDADPVVEAIARIASGVRIPLMHSMMGTLGEKEAWFERLESAGVPAFDDAEDMCVAAGLLAARLHTFKRAMAKEKPDAE